VRSLRSRSSRECPRPIAGAIPKPSPRHGRADGVTVYGGGRGVVVVVVVVGGRVDGGRGRPQAEHRVRGRARAEQGARFAVLFRRARIARLSQRPDAPVVSLRASAANPIFARPAQQSVLDFAQSRETSGSDDEAFILRYFTADIPQEICSILFYFPG